MGVIGRIRTNLDDVRSFGPGFLRRHLGRASSRGMIEVVVPGVGRVAMRSGESDVAAFRQVFQGRDYDLSWPNQHAVWPKAAADRIDARYQAILAAAGTPIIVDAGANIGAASLWFRGAFPKAAVVAIEPDPGNIAMAKRNFGALDRLTLLEAAIGATPGHVNLSNEGMAWAVQTTRAESGLPIVTIDDALAASQGDTPFIVKVDIEGFESDLFANNVGWIEHVQVVFIEPHDWMLSGRGTSRAFQQAMAAHPFELFLRGENLIYVRL